MGRPLQKLQRFLRELKRRNVYRVAVAYIAVAFVVLQGARLLVPALVLPEWFYRVIVALALLGFPLSLVLAWAFEMTPEGVRRTPEEAEPAEEGATERGERRSTGYKVLVGLGLVAAAVAGGWYLTGGGGESPEISDETVAVLPFQVSGRGTEEWREGMVTVLGTGLDGVAGLRAIPAQTVLGVWKRTDQPTGGTGAPRFLDVARRLEARYAVIGSAVKLGGELRLTADVHKTGSGERLGQLEVRGLPDSVTALVDSLSRKVLGVLLQKGGGELPAVNLARVTTRSRSALRAFLEGERHFRAGDFEAAISSYRTAIREDSSFALAYTRLTNAAGWGGIQGARALLRPAYALSDQLPDRERRLIGAVYNWIQTGNRLAAADTLRQLTEAYPDDPTVWYNLGEVLWHGQVPRGWPEAERAFGRAVALAPGVAPYHTHYVDLAFALHRDSALAAERIAAYPGREDRKRLFWIAHRLIFGSPEARREALKQVETIPVPNDWALWLMLRHPTDGRTEDRVLRTLLEREDLEDLRHSRFALVLNDLEHGRVGQATVDLEEIHLSPTLSACYLAGAMTVGLPVPDSMAAAYLDPSNLGENPSLRRLKCAGMYLVEQGRGNELSELASRIRQAPADSTWPTIEMDRSASAAVDLLRGYRAWRNGDLDRARRLLTNSSPWDWWAGTGAIWRGDFYRELGRLETAEGWYQAAWWHPVAHERLGHLYEEMDRPEKAVAAYRRFIEGWENADEELQPRVEAARKRLQELTASESATND